MTLALANWKRQDLAGHVRNGRKLPWFLLDELGWSERRDPTPVEFTAYLVSRRLPTPDWLTGPTLAPYNVRTNRVQADVRIG